MDDNHSEAEQRLRTSWSTSQKSSFFEELHVRFGNWIRAVRFGHGVSFDLDIDVRARVSPQALSEDGPEGRDNLLQGGGLCNWEMVKLEDHVIQVDLVVEQLHYLGREGILCRIRVEIKEIGATKRKLVGEWD